MRNIVTKVKKHYIRVKVKGNINYFLGMLAKLKVELKNIEYLSDKELCISILNNDYLKIKSQFKDIKFKKISDIGIYQIKPMIKKNIILLTCIILGLFLLFFLTRIIVRVDVIHSKKEIRELVKEELEINGIKPLTIKKSYKELQKIKATILDKYPDRLEWLEIEVVGMNIIVRIEERIITNSKEENKFCHIISTKDALITKIVSYSGETVKRVNNYVKKNDVIISGEIKHNEELKENLCAKGYVYGEVWYTVDISIPLSYEEKIATGKTRVNFGYESIKNKKSIFRSRFKNKTSTDTYLFSIGEFKFYYQKEEEYKILPKSLNEVEALEKANVLALEKMKLKLKANDTILMQKVLKKSLNDSTMNIEVFFAVNELISVTSEYTAIEEKEGT